MEYHYLNQGEDPTIPGVDDEQDFIEFVRAFATLNLSEAKLVEIFRVLVGVLFLGNIDFSSTNECASISVSFCIFYNFIFSKTLTSLLKAYARRYST